MSNNKLHILIVLLIIIAVLALGILINTKDIIDEIHEVKVEMEN